jgi:hypothetical protein
MNIPIGLIRNNAKKDNVVKTKEILPNSLGGKSVVATRIIMSASKT